VSHLAYLSRKPGFGFFFFFVFFCGVDGPRRVYGDSVRTMGHGRADGKADSWLKSRSAPRSSRPHLSLFLHRCPLFLRGCCGGAVRFVSSIIVPSRESFRSAWDCKTVVAAQALSYGFYAAFFFGLVWAELS